MSMLRSNVFTSSIGVALFALGCGDSASPEGAAANGETSASGSAGAPAGSSTSGTSGGASGGSSGSPSNAGASGGASFGGNATGGGAGAQSGGSPNAGGAGMSASGGMKTAIGCPSSQPAGTWKDVTPAGMKTTGDFVDGPLTVLVDPAKPTDSYVNAQHDGTWKSTDCGFTYVKVSTGRNADKQNTGSQWGAVIDPNPNRNPNTDPVMYVNQGYGANGLWKSTDGGVNWTDVFSKNVYDKDGRDISGDVGNDLAAPALLSTDDADHLLIFLHSYFGSGGNNGIFETTDGGGKWVLHATPGFNFQPHSDLLSAINASTWWVDHGYPAEFWRSTDAGKTWIKSTGDAAGGMGHSIAKAGDVYYTGSDYHDGVYKTTDQGASWKKLPAPGNKIGWVGVTTKNVYACNGYSGDPPHILHAPLSDDTKWVDDGTPPGMAWCNANNPGVMFDGAHEVLLVPAPGTAPPIGMWRYVDP